MWVLFLNDMRDNHIEDLSPVVFAATKQALLNFVKNEKVEWYKDGRFSKGFRQCGPLEWKNQPNEFSNGHFVEIMAEDRWVDSTGTLAPEQWAVIEAQLKNV